MTKVKIAEYFNPDQHLVFHQDKEGNMIGGGYQVNNLLYQHKMPLFVSAGDGNASNMGGGGVGTLSTGNGDGRDTAENKHFIPEKFSDLFQDLAVPAGLFMMPSLFQPKKYMFDVMDQTHTKENKLYHSKRNHENIDDTEDVGSGSDSDNEFTKQVPSDIFDTLLSLVTPNDRIHHDIKTRRRRGGNRKTQGTQVQNKTRRRKSGTGGHDL